MLHDKAKALLGLERVEQAHQILMEARSLASGMGSDQHLWQILSLLAEVEDKLGHKQGAKSMQEEARQIIKRIADRLESAGLRASFLERAKV